jgi:glycine cleavage system aminomethyltransferase T
MERSMANERPEMLAKSTTLYFGPCYRRSPFFPSTLAAGCSAFDIYNHMYLPAYYDDPDVEYWALVNGVTMWDGGSRENSRSLRSRRQPSHRLHHSPRTVWSPGLEKNIGYAWVPIDLAVPGTTLEVRSEYGEEISATTTKLPFVDPEKRVPAQKLAG